MKELEEQLVSNKEEYDYNMTENIRNIEEFKENALAQLIKGIFSEKYTVSTWLPILIYLLFIHNQTMLCSSLDLLFNVGINLESLAWIFMIYNMKQNYKWENWQLKSFYVTKW